MDYIQLIDWNTLANSFQGMLTVTYVIVTASLAFLGIEIFKS